jgi:hypothetical protein
MFSVMIGWVWVGGMNGSDRGWLWSLVYKVGGRGDRGGDEIGVDDLPLSGVDWPD